MEHNIIKWILIKQTKAFYQAQRCANPVKRSLEQSSNTNTVRRRKSEQRAAAREVPGVREQEQSANTVRWAIARDEPGVPEHESEQWAAAREVPGVREQEQSANTVRQAIAR